MIRYALTQIRGLTEVDMTQALLGAIRNVSVTYPHLSLPVAKDGNALQCTHYTSPQAQNRAKNMWYENRHVCRAKQCRTVKLCAFELAPGEAVRT